MIWWTIGLPIIGFLFQALFGRQIQASSGGKKMLGLLAVLPIAIAFGIGFMITQSLDPKTASIVTSFSWIDLVGFNVPFELRIDTLSMTMVLIITGIGALIHIYATGYMAEEKDYSRFFSYLNLFIAAMLILVLGNNLLLLFIGWEGVGLCSYLLIGFWYKDLANAKAANKAFIVNRIGDWGLTLGLFLIVSLLLANKSVLAPGEARLLSYDVILPALKTILVENPQMATALGILLFVGACGKSAQFPLYTWLPDAMAGPTPVSALIHAATMVTSGVVLLNRMHVVFEASPQASMVVCVIGAFTALFAAVIAFGQTDIKKVLAYSTVSQLGFMFVACGAGAYWVGMFHVTTHAFFKALLFLGSGAVIHAMAHDQDMRNYGKLSKRIPITFITMAIGWFAIAGVPGLSGFFSKEAILGSALANNSLESQGFKVAQYSGWVCVFVALLTAMYMTRMMFLTFFGNKERWRDIAPTSDNHHDDDHHPDDHHHVLDSTHEPKEVPFAMSLPLIVLAILSIAGGYLMHKDDAFKNWLAASSSTPGIDVPLHPEGIPLVAISIGAALLGLIAGAIVYVKGLPEKEGFDLGKWSLFRKNAANQFGYDALLTESAVDGGRVLATGLDQGIDTGLVNGMGVGAGEVTQGIGKSIGVLQSGLVRLYALVMLCGVIGLISWVVIASQGVAK
jgi:NADH-quinone oxidoreductase subunit L